MATNRWKVTPGLVALGFLLASLGLAAQTATEGYDPMIQITHQIAKPIVYVLVDLTDAMAQNEDAINPTANQACGENPLLEWQLVPDPSSEGNGTNRGKYKVWWFTLNITQERPGHLQIIKNVLGNGVVLFKTWKRPASWPALASVPATLPTPTITGPGYVRDHPSSTDKYTWTYTFGSFVAPASWGAYIPFAAYDGSGAPTIGSTGNHETVSPLNLVAKTSKIVDWGFLQYSSGASPNCSTNNPQNKCSHPADVTDPGTISSDLARDLDCASASCLGWNLGGKDNLLQGLMFSGQVLRNTYLGQSNSYEGSDDCTYATDSKAACARTYSTLLFAAGQSNKCNRSTHDGFWTSDCSGPCPQGPNCCPGSTHQINASGVDCGIATWDQFPPYAADQNWRNPAAGQLPLRTFVIGASALVSPCEMNILAYMGRTDASSPLGDGGFKLGADGNPVDPRLPRNTGDATANFDPSLPYAYLATTSDAIAEAFMSVVAAVAAGDYTTTAPVASSALTTTTAAVLASTEYPGWKGHLWSFDTTRTSTESGYVMWDAGWNLSKSHLPVDDTAGTWVEGTTANPAFVAPANRKLYTWNPADNSLVELRSANLATLNTICGSCGLTAATIDFIRGNNGAGAIRPWVLGSIINSSPAITQKPETFFQGTLEDHRAFETAHADRTPLAWVGADDGMLHAFQLVDGREVFGLMPPNLLANQPKLHTNYLLAPAKSPTGQPASFEDHIYGFAGSPRYADMFDGSAYKTVMLLTTGPGGYPAATDASPRWNIIAGIDTSDPVANIAAGNAPAAVLWSKRAGSGYAWPYLFNPWSTPAAGASSRATTTGPSVWTGLVGAGFNSASCQTCPGTTTPHQVTPQAMVFNPLTGVVSNALSPAAGTVSTPVPLVGNQTFADGVIYRMEANAYYPDNIVNLGLQADLHGRIWFIPGPNFSSASIGIDATAKTWSSTYAANQQPIYYSSAVNAYTSGGLRYDLYVFGSGTVYERSTKVTGTNIGQTGYFIPSLYLVAKGQNASQATDTEILRIPIPELYAPEDLTAEACVDPANQELVGTYRQTLCRGTTHVRLGRRTQLTAPPALFVPIPGNPGTPVALFLLYDPDTPDACAGRSYIVKIAFSPSEGTPSIRSTTLYGAGEGAASGFAVAGNTVIIAKSAVGEGSRAGISTVPGLNPTAGMSNPTPIWWRELK